MRSSAFVSRLSRHGPPFWSRNDVFRVGGVGAEVGGKSCHRDREAVYVAVHEDRRLQRTT